MSKSIKLIVAVTGATVLLLIVFRRIPAGAISSIPITLTAGPSKISLSVPSSVYTVGDFIRTYGIEQEGSIITPAVDTLLVPQMVITIIPTRNFILSDGTDDPEEITTAAKTVGGALVTIGTSLGPLDKISPSLAATLSNDMAVRITRIKDIKKTESVSVPFDTIYVDDVDSLWGNESILTVGKNGSTEEDVRIRIVNNEVSGRTVLSSRLIEEPSAQIVSRGVKIVVDRIQEGNGSWYKYKDCDCAAHNEYPRGTWLRVTNLLDGAQQIVKTNDWGPDPAVHPDRVIDLDATVFKRFAPLWKGVIPVRVERLVTTR